MMTVAIRASLVAGLMLASLGAGCAAPLATASVATPDNPEIAKQGETLPGEDVVLPRPYSKGVDIVGHTDIGGQVGNLAMAWSGTCAYVADGLTIKREGGLDMPPAGPSSGVAVIDVSDPSAPKVTRLLRDKGSIRATETLHAVTAGERSLRPASRQGFADIESYIGRTQE